MSALVEAKAPLVKGEISRIADAAHLEFSGLTSWDYQVSRPNPNEISLVLPAIDAATEAKLKNYDGFLIKKIAVAKDAPDQKYEIKFTLSDANVESFDYLTDDPSRLIIDFYRQEPTQQQSANLKPQPIQKLKPNKKSVTSSSDYQKVKRSTRNPAGDELLSVGDIQGSSARPDNEDSVDISIQRGAFDGGDPTFSRFNMKDYEIKDESIIASKQNIYLPFPMLKMPVSLFKQTWAEATEYEIKPRETQENKEARLLKTLFDNERNAVFLKTYDYFLKNYPDSEYDEIVKNMAAEVHFRLWLKDSDAAELEKGKAIYTYLLQKYPKSVLNERTELLLAYADLERGDGLSTISDFQNFIATRPGSKNLDQAKKGLAEGFLKLKKWDEALKVYQEMLASDQSLSKPEVTFRLGDVYFSQNKFSDAVAAYQTAIKKYPGLEKKFPNAFYNMAEAQFALKEYKNSLDNYINYIRYFPASDYGGYAMTRVGELLEILGADQTKVMGAFLESTFRYHDHPGASVARIRMTSQRMKGMQDKELKKSLDEIREIVRREQFPKISEFATLLVSDGYRRRGEFQTALDQLIDYYQENPITADKTLFQKKISSLISSVLYQKIENGDFLGALNFAGHFANTWLKNSDRLDVPFFVGRAYEEGGVFAEADKAYQKTENALQKIAGSQEEKERKVNERLPSLDTVRLRRARVFLGMRKYSDAAESLRAIKNPKTLATEDQVERVEIAAEVSEARGENDLAKKNLKDLTSAWAGKPELVAPVYLKLAKLYLGSDQIEQSLGSLAPLEKMKKQDVNLPESLWAEVLQTKGDALLKQGKDVAAVAAYSELLNQYPNANHLSSVRYKAGQILFNRGDIIGAKKFWDGFDETKEGLYKSLAQEKLNNFNWQSEYKKYIKRIPAMSQK